jgi:alkylhydroperoxidase family enzyme
MTVTALDDLLDAELARLVALSPRSGARTTALIRLTCGQALSLPALPAEIAVTGAESEVESLIADFAEQFTVDVAAVTAQQRAELSAALGPSTFGTVVHMYIADLLPRVRAGFQALGILAPWAEHPPQWDHDSDPAGAVFNTFLPGVGRLRALDPVTSEVVRLRGASQHNCRLCKSLREGGALDAGGSESLYADIERFESSPLLTNRHKAALRYVDALIWSPGSIGADTVADVRSHFSNVEARELTLDVMRNASNKIAVALGADAPRVEDGTERYLIDADGQTVFA